jgi:hypothetical protein
MCAGGRTLEGVIVAREETNPTSLPENGSWTSSHRRPGLTGRSRGRVRAVAITLALVVGVGLEAAKIKIRAEAEPGFDFATLKTWAWTPDKLGDVLLAREYKEDPAPLKQKAEPVITEAVEKEFGARGLVQALAGAPDFTVHYFLLVTAGAQAQHMGQFVPAVVDWGLPLFAPATQSLEYTSRGALVLDVSSPAGHLVWRGVGESDFDQYSEEEKRRELIREVVKGLVKKLPKQATKKK